MTRRIIIGEFVTLCVFVGCLTLVEGKNCPNVTPLKDFNLTRLAGRWYVARVFSNRETKSSRCESFDFVMRDEGEAIVQHGESNRWRHSVSTSSFFLHTPDNSKPGKLKANFWAVSEVIDFTVVQTDYSSYAFLHLCTEDNGGNSQYTFFITRQQSVDFKKFFLHHLFLVVGNISTSHHARISQRGCFYPTPLVIRESVPS